MHLSECIDLTSSTKHCDWNGISHCLLNWLLKTKTEFYGWDDSLKLNPLFGLLCWSYTCGGIMMYLLLPKWRAKTSFPFTFFALLLTFIQGPLSFIADYMNMTKDSNIHVLDRIMALFCFILQIWRLSSLWCHVRTNTFFFHLGAFIFAIFCFMNSQEAQQFHDPDGFIFWHNLWHIYPLLCTLIELYDKFILGEFEVTEELATQRSRNLENLKSDVLAYFFSYSTRPLLDSESTDTKKKC